jgi:membrane-associated phospholipid phosphatase
VKELANRAQDATFFRQRETLSAFLSDSRYIFRPLPVGSTQASPTPVYPPPGSVYNRRQRIDQPHFLRNGLELARLFEAETPGLWHRHVLNIILDPTIPGGPGTMLSPPRQALIWAALDVAISSALQAAWYFKWFSLDERRFSFRRRPWEADQGLTVEYDYMLAYDPAGNIIRGGVRNDPPGSPGTPRHPAYPSGHSTYSAAASVVLGCLFPKYRSSFNLLANNIGRARIWAGVHWFQDHEEGQRIGKRVGEMIIAQLNESGIPVIPQPLVPPPDHAALRRLENGFYEAAREGLLCGNSARRGEDFCDGVVRGAGPGAVENSSQGGEDQSPGMMNPGPEYEDAGARSDMPPADEAAHELDIDTPPPST